MRRRLALAVAAILVAAGAVAFAATRDPGDAERPAPGDRPARSKAAGIGTSPAPSAGAVDHLRALQEIADSNGGNRAAGTPGYRASARYVAARLRDAGWSVRVQRLRFPFFEERGEPQLRVAGRRLSEVRTLQYSSGGSALGPLREVDPRGPGEGAERDAGCRASDFAGVRRGAVVLIERGTCRMRLKVENAEDAGAVAAVIANDGRPGRTEAIAGSLGSPGTSIPAVFVSHGARRELSAGAGRRVRVGVRAVSERRATVNVIADSPRPSRAGRGQVVMAGAHLDSVTAGAGINDNGSGVAALLRAAESLSDERGRALRLGFWGAEELGLLGSKHYVESLGAAERKRIDSYLNLDMVGSGNGGRFVYAGDDERSREIAAVARRVLDRAGVESETTGLGGGSDHASFASAGIPVAGLFSGASEHKDGDQRRRWGGQSGEPFAACYHRRCDRLSDIDRAALSELGRAATATLRSLLRAPG